MNPGRPAFPTGLFWAAIAGLAVVAVWLGGLLITSRTENGFLRQEADLANIALRRAVGQLEAERIVSRGEADDLHARNPAHFEVSTLTSAREDSRHAFAVVVWDPSTQEGLVAVGHLPALAPGQDYQLWITDPLHPSPVSAGVFKVNPATGGARHSFKVTEAIRSAKKFMVTLENEGGGSRVPQGAVVLSSE